MDETFKAWRVSCQAAIDGTEVVMTAEAAKELLAILHLAEIGYHETRRDRLCIEWLRAESAKRPQQ